MLNDVLLRLSLNAMTEGFSDLHSSSNKCSLRSGWV